MSPAFDVIVVGAGNAAFCAALAAQEGGARVLMLERAPEAENGGNSRFTAGGMRIAYRGVDDLKMLMPDLTSEEIASTDFGSYTTDQFFEDMFRVTRFRADAGLSEQLVRRSFDATLWLHRKGVRFVPIYGRQTIKVDGKHKFWGGVTVESWGGGPGWTVEGGPGAPARGAVPPTIGVRRRCARTGVAMFERSWSIPSLGRHKACG